MSANPVSRVRCAVYTRKSTEEGLEQEFNSLDAQREACEAYIVSQASLGWKLVVDRYDDGGISGGTMNRPALQRLLQDIRDRKVDVVVVYKIDRLTRSLGDFSKMVEVFDAVGASFVSVTQQFNTTTSMGRLTLNVLLSFAQFEREVTAERIRDKIAASKKKGMWMGGSVPLGYRVEARKLIVDETEAAIIRYLFDRYLQLKSVRGLAAEASARGFSARPRSKRGGEGAALLFGRGQLYHLLSNPIYVGSVRHKTQTYVGEHQAIIDADTFAGAQALLTDQAPRRRSVSNQADLHLLTGLLFDERGDRLRAVHTRTRDVRYRYYVSRHHVEERGSTKTGWRLPAGQIEAAIEQQLDRLLANTALLTTTLQALEATIDAATLVAKATALRRDYPTLSALKRRDMMRTLIARIELKPGTLSISVRIASLASTLMGKNHASQNHAAEHLQLEHPMSLRRRGSESKLVLTGASRTAKPDEALVNLIVRARRYLDQLTDGAGRTIGEVATLNRVDRSDVGRTLPLAFLAPPIVEAILTGSQPANLTARHLSRLPDLPLSWSRQAELLA
jgi:DNA invertase Pin-like site-specific DNA recombinase